MSPRPAIFVSAASTELRSARQLVANTLTFLGYEVVWQDIFGTQEGDLREVLRRRIDTCQGVLQLVGECYGTEPPSVDHQFGRVSYTQYEALYACAKKKKVWYLFLDSGFPSDPHPPEDEAKRKLQSDYRARVRSDVHLHHPVDTREGLEASVLKLRDELTRLRRGGRRWAALVLVLLILTVGLGFLHLQQQNQAQERLTGQFAAMRDIIGQFAQAEAAQRQSQVKEESDTIRRRAMEELAKQYGLDPKVLEKQLPIVAETLKRAPNASVYERASAAYVAMDYNETERLALTAADQALAASPPNNSEAIKAFELAGLADDKRIEYVDALKRLRQAEGLTNRTADPSEWARVQFAIAGVLHDQGRYRDSEQVLREVLTERERVLGDENPDTLATRHRLAEELEAQGNYPSAEPEYRAVIKLQEKVLGPEHPDVLRTRNGLANTLEDQGKYGEAETEYRAVLELRKKVLGPENVDTLSTRHNVAGVLEDEAKYAEAETEYREVVKLREKVLGPEHPDTLASRDNLAGVLDDEGKSAEAESEYRAVLKLKEKVLGPEHPRTLLTRGNLAATLHTQGKYAEAETENRALIRLREKTVGPEHPTTLVARSNLAEALNQQGKYGEAEAEDRAVIELEQKVLGPEHPATLETRENLGTVLANQGKYEEAETEFRAVLKIKEKALGPEHPNTLRIDFDLANCLRAEKEIPEARDFAQRAADGALKVLGPDHPETKKYHKLRLELEETGT